MARRPDIVGAHQFDQHAFAQPAIGNAQPLTGKNTADGLQNGATRQHEIGPLRTDAGARDASGGTSALFYVSNAAQIAASLKKGLLVLKGRRLIENVVGQTKKLSNRRLGLDHTG